MVGSSLGYLTLSSGRGSVEAWYTSAVGIEEVLSGAADSHVHLFVADVVKSFDTVDRVFWIVYCLVLVFLLGSVMLTFEYHAHVRVRFKLASGLGQSWTRDGVFLRVSFEHDVHCGFVSHLV